MRETALRMVLAVMDKRQLSRQTLRLGIMQSFTAIVQHRHTKEMCNLTVSIFGNGDVTVTGASDDGDGCISFRLKYDEMDLYPGIKWETIGDEPKIYHFGKVYDGGNPDPFDEPEHRVYTNGLVITSRGEGELKFNLETSEEAMEFLQLMEDKITRAHRIDVNPWFVVNTNREED